MNTREFAAALGVPIGTVTTWINRGMPHKPSTGASIDQGEAMEWLQEKKANTKRRDAFNIYIAFRQKKSLRC